MDHLDNWHCCCRWGVIQFFGGREGVLSRGWLFLKIYIERWIFLTIDNLQWCLPMGAGVVASLGGTIYLKKKNLGEDGGLFNKLFSANSLPI